MYKWNESSTWQIYNSMIDWCKTDCKYNVVKHQFGTLCLNEYKLDSIFEKIKNVTTDIEIWISDKDCIKFDNGQAMIDSLQVEESDTMIESTGNNEYILLFDTDDYEDYI